jgi:hypothetical protein
MVLGVSVHHIYMRLSSSIPLLDKEYTEKIRVYYRSTEYQGKQFKSEEWFDFAPVRFML